MSGGADRDRTNPGPARGTGTVVAPGIATHLGGPGARRSTGERRRLEALLGVPFTAGNRIDVLRNGVQIFPGLLQGIAGASRSIDMLWFQWGCGDVSDALADALADRARAGVRVRILLDAFGSRGVATAQLHRMGSAGCEVAFFRPLRTWRLTTLNLRTHCRVLVCDETVGFTGGMGIDRAWTGDADGPASWRDTGYRFQGPVVDGLRAAFAMAWLQTSLPMTSRSDAFPEHPVTGDVDAQALRVTSQPGWNAAALAALELLAIAHHRVRIATPYTRLPERFHIAIAEAIRRGVAVEVLVSGPHVDRRIVAAQSHAQYDRLLRAGAHIWTYCPTLLHTKLVTVDSRFALIGTTNFDARSFVLNEQIAVVIDNPRLAGELDRDFEDDLRNSARLVDHEWRTRGQRQRALEKAADVLGTPMRGGVGAGLSRRSQAARRGDDPPPLRSQ